MSDTTGNKAAGRPAAALSPQRRRAVTIRDVALAAGVSAMTVSNVIKNNGQRVREETRKRVMLAITELNYRPASSARSLRLGKRHSIGVVIVDKTSDFLSNPFVSRFVSGLCGVLNEKGYVMIVQGIHPDDFESSFPLRRAEADAYCIRLNGAPEQRANMLRALERLQEPLIFIQETLALGGGDRMAIRQDDHGGAQLLAEHLLARGARSAAVMVPRYAGPMTAARVAGYTEAFDAVPGGFELDIITADHNTFSSGMEAMKRYLEGRKPPDAFLGANDELALSGLRALQDRGFRVPKDVMVTGFDGFEPPSYVQPSLTTIVSPALHIGEEAGRMLMQRLDGEAFPSVDHVLPVTFRRGQSTS